ncbi:MAG: ABC-2 family transporter protein [Nitrospinota bacterium]|nr:ABC-2 family transporter protein [Nitrospinota bacterium]
MIENVGAIKNGVMARSKGAEEKLFDALERFPALSLYIKFAFKAFQRQLAYKFEYFVGVVNGLIFIFIFTSLWKNIFSNSQATESVGFTTSGIVSYAVFAMIIRISMSQDDLGVMGKIRTGAIAMDMIKPFNFFGVTLAENVGGTMFHWFTRAAPILAVCLIFFDVSLPRHPVNYLLLAVTWILGYLIYFMVNWLFAMLAFWVIETFSFQLMKYGMFTLFSGGIIPLDFFPDFIRPAVAYIPFMYILYVPTASFIGHISPAEALGFIAFQGVWVATLGLASVVVWRAAQKKLIIQGG